MAVKRGDLVRFGVAALLAGGAWLTGYVMQTTGDNSAHTAQAHMSLYVIDATMTQEGSNAKANEADELVLWPLKQSQIDRVLKRPIPATDSAKANRIMLDQLNASNWSASASDAQAFTLVGWSLFGFGFVILGTTGISLKWRKRVNMKPAEVLE